MLKDLAAIFIWFVGALSFAVAGIILLDSYSGSGGFHHRYPLVIGILSAAIGIILLCWMLWGVFVGVVAGIFHLAGQTSRAHSWLRFSPAVIRRVIIAALGMSLIAVPSYAVDLGFEGSTTPTHQTVSTEVTNQAEESLHEPEVGLAEEEKNQLEIRLGDSLWRIASAELGSEASVSEISERWQQWYQTNREVIGSDPHLIQPGMILTIPALKKGSSL